MNGFHHICLAAVCGAAWNLGVLLGVGKVKGCLNGAREQRWMFHLAADTKTASAIALVDDTLKRHFCQGIDYQRKPVLHYCVQWSSTQ